MLERELTTVLSKEAAKPFIEHLGMQTIGDLLWHLPRRHYRRGDLTDFADIEVGEFVTLAARITNVASHTSYPRGKALQRTIVTISDGRRSLDLVFFNLKRFQLAKLVKGESGMFSGTVNRFNSKLQLQHPEWELFDDLDDSQQNAWVSGLVPVYPATKKVSSLSIRKAVRTVLERVDLAEVTDAVPQHVRESHGLMRFGEALGAYHVAESDERLEEAKRALKWHEALQLQASLVVMREFTRRLASTARPAGALLAEFDSRLPFDLTPDQHQIGDQIAADLDRQHPMHRLVQGEVGSGKTMVALRAMLQVAETGGQSVMLAPTEVLASQHFRSIVDSLGPELAARLHPVLITGQQPAAERKRSALAAASGQSLIAVGTHALISKKTTFADVGLVVIDEQHRFGVGQREALRSKGVEPHTLLLTATPIPRTVAMTVFGDLDVSELRTMPAGRTPIGTHVVSERQRPGLMARAWQRVGEEIAAGRQAFVVCPAIEPGEAERGADLLVDPLPGVGQQGMADVATTLERLRRVDALRGVRMAALTGAMSADEKDGVMRAYAAGELDLLVATTVIEVGVNVPNATVMVVLDADRFGLSQLHQLRGRVGRGEHPGLCLLVTSAAPGSTAGDRVAALAETTDGFAIAEFDLAQRHEGDVLGRRQSGVVSSLKVLRVGEDADIIREARIAAGELIEDDPLLERTPTLRQAVAALSAEARVALQSA
ncbi:MAG: ATP-dependent DNA helicase RecG [Agrococcus casei]|uniref:ATP-dependent DNA helicase RecG n=1 Tax=Agrococcus casei TaxID=343512 RepID=UPI003F8DB29A